MGQNADYVLDTPLTAEQIRERLTADGMVSGLVMVDLSDLIDGDLESVLDLLSEKLVGSCLGMEIDYEAIRIEQGSIVMRVTVDPSMVLDDDEQIDSSEPEE